eukprot:13786786-Ditylum_brightwellii.AAC.1
MKCGQLSLNIPPFYFDAKQRPFAHGELKDYITHKGESSKAITELSRKKHQKKALSKNDKVSVDRRKEFAMKGSDLKLNWKMIEKV